MKTNLKKLVAAGIMCALILSASGCVSKSSSKETQVNPVETSQEQNGENTSAKQEDTIMSKTKIQRARYKKYNK